jgi:hypothetical protein
MRKLFASVLLAHAFLTGHGQDASNYVMHPGASATVFTGGKLNLFFQYISTEGAVINGASDLSIANWTINGNSAGQGDDAAGTLRVTDGMNATAVEYTAPDHIPATNPVVVAVSFHPYSGSKSMVTLLCNITLVAGYKVTVDMELTGPAGVHISLSGESMTQLKPLADGTYMLEPLDKKSDMNMTVKDFSMTKVTFLGPFKYTIPLFISIGKIGGNGSAPAKLVLARFGISDPSESYMADGHTTQTHMIEPLFFNVFIKEFLLTDKKNIADAADEKAWADRMQAHKGDPAYFKTVQGQQDIQRLQKLQQEMGSTVNNPDVQAQQLAQQISQKAQQDPGYMGSAQYQKDIGREELLAQGNKGTGGQTPTSNVRMHGLLNIEGNFNAASSTPLEMTKESSSGGFQAEIKVKVVKG